MDTLTPDYFQQEVDLIRELFDLNDIIEFQKEHDIQIIKGADCQYECWINKKCFDVSLTPLGAMTLGIKKYKDEAFNNNSRGDNSSTTQQRSCPQTGG